MKVLYVGNLEPSGTCLSRFRGLHSRARLLESQVSVDFKTGLTSDRYFRRILDLEWKRAQRHQNPLSLLLIDGFTASIQIARFR